MISTNERDPVVQKKKKYKTVAKYSHSDENFHSLNSLFKVVIYYIKPLIITYFYYYCYYQNDGALHALNSLDKAMWCSKKHGLCVTNDLRLHLNLSSKT